MQLPDESISYDYQGLLVPASEEWSPAAEVRSQHFLDPARLRALIPQLMQIRSQVAAEREFHDAPPENRPLEAGFIDLPQATLDNHRRKAEASDLGRVIAEGTRLRNAADRLIILGLGGAAFGARALFEALKSRYHNEMLPEARMGVPRIYFEGDGSDNDALNDLLELLQTTCVDPQMRDERWALIAVQANDDLEIGAAYRVFRREARDFYGSRADQLRELFVPVTKASGKFRDLCLAEGYAESDLLTLPANVGSRYGVFTIGGILPAAVMGLDIRALLLGAAAMTRRFVEEPFERNPVLQYAGVNYLLAAEKQKPIRVLSVWSKKLEALGQWYDQLVAGCLGKQGKGPTPLTVVQSRGIYARGQQHRDGTRDKLVNNLLIKTPRTPPIQIGMADRNEDDLNALARKSLADVLDTSLRVSKQTASEAARPTADLVVPTLSEHSMGQLMQLLMLATVVEARLWGVNPYGQSAVDSHERLVRELLKK